MLGSDDGFAIAQVPGSAQAAALSAMISGTGAFRAVQTHELLTQDQLSQTLQLASRAGQAFQRPGQS
jgi:hypothetical protein